MCTLFVRVARYERWASSTRPRVASYFNALHSANPNTVYLVIVNMVVLAVTYTSPYVGFSQTVLEASERHSEWYRLPEPITSSTAHTLGLPTTQSLALIGNGVFITGSLGYKQIS